MAFARERSNKVGASIFRCYLRLILVLYSCQTIFDGTWFLYRSLKVGRARPFSNAGHERKDEVERHII